MVDKRKEEFKRSFEKYYPVLCNIAYRYLLDKETSEDIVQDTMLSVWQNKKDLLPESFYQKQLYFIFEETDF